MTNYREYRGLYGKPVRVAAHTITATSGHYDGGSYPFVQSAQRMGVARDAFAQLAVARRPFFAAVERDRSFQTLAAKAGPFPA